MREPKLTIQGVSKRYSSVVALEKTDLTVAEGEFVTLLGPSGSGKTTLLMIVAGLIAPDSGDLVIGGTNATYQPPSERDIGMVFQNYALFPHLTIYENIAFPLRMRRMREADIQKAVREALETVQLPTVGARYPRELSGGQQQRVALARCFVYRPSIILMDEPLGALDRKLRDEIQQEIKALHRKLNMTALYVTHDQDEAMLLSDRICLMQKGAIEQVGSPEDLYMRPRSHFAAQFFGEANIFKGIIREINGTRVQLTCSNDLQLTTISNVPNLAVGQAVEAMVRPESVKVAGGGQTPPETNSVLVSDLRSVMLGGGLTRSSARLGFDQHILLKSLTSQGTYDCDSARVFWSWSDTVLLTEGP